MSEREADRGGLTVAVCTRNRPELLRRALRSLCALRPPADEILVVDNGSEGIAAATVAREIDGTIRTVVEPVAGLDFARNRALREARFGRVAFLDDDAVADPGWAGAISAQFDSRPDVAAVTGRVLPLMLDTDGQRLFEANGGFDRGERRITLPDDASARLHGLPAPRIAWAVSVGSGSSLAVRRDAVLRIGGFDEALDLGEALPGGGDHDVLWRLLEVGQRIAYEPAALAHHEHRRGVDDACAQIAGHQRALVALLVKCLSTSRWPGKFPILAYLGWRLVKPGVRLARRAVGADPLPARAILRAWGACWGGLVAYDAARRIAIRRRSGSE